MKTDDDERESLRLQRLDHQQDRMIERALMSHAQDCVVVCRMCKDHLAPGSLDDNGLCRQCRRDYRVCDCGEIYERGSICLKCIESLIK
jgi:hypothetical protein